MTGGSWNLETKPEIVVISWKIAKCLQTMNKTTSPVNLLVSEHMSLLATLMTSVNVDATALHPDQKVRA